MSWEKTWKKLLKTKRCRQDTKIHSMALAIAVLGPLLNFWIGPLYEPFIINSYVYWAVALGIYVAILMPFVLKVSKPSLTMARLVVIGIPVEDFCSNLWNSVFTGQLFLPFCNWYTQHFPFLGSLGEPTPLLLVPQWYIVAAVVYALLTFVQYKDVVSGRRK